MEWVSANYGEIFGTMAAFVLFFDRLAKLTPTESDNKLLAALYRVFSVLGVKVPDISTYGEKK